MTRGPSPRSIRIGDAVVALLRDHAADMTTKEICEGLGRWDMESDTSCPQDAVKRAKEHEDRHGSTFVSCLLKPRRGQEWHDFGEGRYDWVVHTWNRTLWSGDIQSVLARLVKSEQIIKLRLDRYNATVYSAPPALVPADDLEAMWAR